MLSYVSADAKHVHQLVDFGKREFTRTFGHLYSKEDLEEYLSSAYTVEKYQKWIDDSENYFLAVAESQETSEIKGYVLSAKFCELPLDESLPDQPGLSLRSAEIKRLYVSPDVFGVGVAYELMARAFQWFEIIKLTAPEWQLMLGVFSENIRAQRFYEKHGFKFVGEYKFQVGNHFDHELIMQYNPISSEEG